MFHENDSKSFRVIAGTRNHDRRTDRQTDRQDDYYRASADFVWRGPKKIENTDYLHIEHVGSTNN